MQKIITTLINILLFRGYIYNVVANLFTIAFGGKPSNEEIHLLKYCERCFVASYIAHLAVSYILDKNAISIVMVTGSYCAGMVIYVVLKRAFPNY